MSSSRLRAAEPRPAPSPGHLTFGSGRHLCLGAPLARLEIKTALQRMLAAFPRMRLDPDAVIAFTGEHLRGLASLPLRLS